MLIFEVLILILISAALTKEIARRYQIRGEIKKLQAQAGELEKKNTDLGQLVSQISSSTYKEEQARLKLGLQKPGESVVVVLGESTDNQNNNSAVSSTPTEASLTHQTSNPQRWWKYFFSTKNLAT